MARHKQRSCRAPIGSGLGLVAGAMAMAALPAWAVNHEQLMQLLERKACKGCRLQDADLVHADLRDAQLQEKKNNSKIKLNTH